MEGSIDGSYGLAMARALVHKLRRSIAGFEVAVGVAVVIQR